MRKNFGVVFLILVVTFSLLAPFTKEAIAEELVLLPGLHPTWVPKSKLFSDQPAALPSERGLKPEEEVLIGSYHPIWVSKSQAISDQKALLPSELGLESEELVLLPGLHPTWVPKSRVR